MLSYEKPFAEAKGTKYSAESPISKKLIIFVRKHADSMDRRDFIKTAAAAGAAYAFASCGPLFAAGEKDPAAGKTLAPWKKGQFQVHFIYTGAAESLVLIFPDGTSMLLDCGEQDTVALGERAVPRLPDHSRLAGEWIARYVSRVNPHGTDVDYMMLSHYHCDHAGCETVYSYDASAESLPYALSGFGEAAQTLRFGKAFDRCWPDYTEPIPLLDDQKRVMSQMRKFYAWQQEHRGLAVERFLVGAVDQVRMLHRPSAYPAFHIRNLCGNGWIAAPDGALIDLYAGEKEGKERINENAFSLGMVFSYGPFRFYSAGDFSHRWNKADGTPVDIEKELAKVVESCQVAKINHHGHHSMPTELVAALRSRVWICSTWNQRHCTDDTLEHLEDRGAYPGERLVCPCLMPFERRVTMDVNGDTGLLDDVAKDSFEAGHVVLTVEKGGRDYSVTYVKAADESMRVRSVMRFKSV